MREELLNIENGKLRLENNQVFKRLNLEVLKSGAVGVIFDDVSEQIRLKQLFRGEISLDEGKIELLGNRILPEEVGRYFNQSVDCIDRDTKLIDTITIADNLFLLRDEDNHFFVNSHSYDKKIAKLEKMFSINISNLQDVKSLNNKERIQLEILKAFLDRKHILVLANISSLLNENELREICELSLKMRAQGLGFIIIEPFDNMILEWTEQLIVIKNGKTMGKYSSKDADIDEIYTMLLLEDADKRKKIPRINQDESEEWKPLLEFRNITTSQLTNINFTVGNGEIYKIYFTEEDTCSHLVNILAGETRDYEGEVFLSGRRYNPRSTSAAFKRGIGFIEELASDSMILQNMSVFENIALLLGEKVGGFWIRHRFQKNIRKFLLDYITEEELYSLPRELEPIKRQQILYYRMLLFHPKLIVCIKPFSQEDIHLRKVTIDLIKMLRNQGISVIVLTSKYGDLQLIEGENIYLRNGRAIDEEEVYKFLYEAEII